MLNVLTRYTKLFLNDKKMKLKLKREIHNSKTISNFDSLPTLEFYLIEDEPSCAKIFTPIQIDYRRIHQNFKLSYGITQYIIKNASPEVLQKLKTSTKYFFYLPPICYKFIVQEEISVPEFNLQSLRLVSKNFDANNIPNNLHISNNFTFHCSDPTKLHSMIPKLHRCDARFIYLHNQNLTYDELKFLLNPKRVEKLTYVKNLVIKNDGNEISIEDIFDMVPNATYFW